MFWFSESAPRRFRMPDTRFDLHIVFLDEDLGIIHVARNMQARPGWETSPPIARTPVIFARHVLMRRRGNVSPCGLREGRGATPARGNQRWTDIPPRHHGTSIHASNSPRAVDFMR
uniref:Uncharacterized ACR, COG1430 n=1 Tax=Candidatus Kentrum sp. SD TaxID=2126332 RepID=A0A450YR26_9GAMM|nr:MAG: Uncharacterized ACR, COG1430 [Candidatus Kentron sp. SD]VFK49304.1 MAG: Uncharacterized ACR, COG1430 [Candidatus Kentron sp. SD]